MIDLNDSGSGLDGIIFRLRTRRLGGSGKPTAISEQSVSWDAKETAIIVCDMWDRHWCDGATARVGELARVMEKVICQSRKKGVLIVHAPSDTMEHYRDFPQRLRAVQAPPVSLPEPSVRPFEPPLPIDDSDGGCTTSGGKPRKAWNSQHPAITVNREDAISDDGLEIYNLFAQRGIKNVVLMGVHTNMCVLGRSFGLRKMVEFGMNVVLMRDLTDSMYNPDRFPFVSHFEGTARVVAHIETYVCPTVVSSDITGEPPFRFLEDLRAEESIHFQ